jgi:hypothetical protein
MGTSPFAFRVGPAFRSQEFPAIMDLFSRAWRQVSFRPLPDLPGLDPKTCPECEGECEPGETAFLSFVPRHVEHFHVSPVHHGIRNR